MNDMNKVILSIMVLAILIIPSIALDYVDDLKRDEIVNLGNGNYEYTYHEKTYIDSDLVIEQWDSTAYDFYGINDNVDIYCFADNESYHGGAIYFGNNSLTYIGNGTYSFDIDTFMYSDTAWTRLDFYIPFNITSHNITKYDFVRIIATPNVNMYIKMFKTEIDTSTYTLTPVTTEIYPPHQVVISALSVSNKNLIPVLTIDNPVYTFINGDLSETEYTIKFEKIESKNQTVFTLSDETQFYIILTSTIAISIFTIIFMTNIIDIRIDTNKNNKWRK